MAHADYIREQAIETHLQRRLTIDHDRRYSLSRTTGSLDRLIKRE
jgi:hypothetical protein